MQFKRWLSESVYFHGTSKENAAAILKNGIDPSKYQSGMWIGTYLTPNRSFFKHNEKYEVILKMDIDPNKLIDVKDITDEDLENYHPGYRAMSYGYKNHLITQIAKEKGYSGLIDGNQVVVFDNKCIDGIEVVNEI